jgi:hypothetical protein
LQIALWLLLSEATLPFRGHPELWLLDAGGSTRSAPFGDRGSAYQSCGRYLPKCGAEASQIGAATARS